MLDSARDAQSPANKSKTERQLLKRVVEWEKSFVTSKGNYFVPVSFWLDEDSDEFFENGSKKLHLQILSRDNFLLLSQNHKRKTKKIYAQKRLAEITMSNPYFEEIDIKEILDFDKYQGENFKNMRSIKAKLTVVEGNPNVQHYRFKGTKDIIVFSAILNNESIKNWKESVKTSIEMYNTDYESHIEELELKNAQGVIQMFDEYYIPNNYLYYQNKKQVLVYKLCVNLL